jgi:uncharacterized protein YjbI with pentapeptide repeats
VQRRYLAHLTPGDDIDHRGTPFTGDLLDSLLSAFRDPVTQAPRIGNAHFEGATFSGIAQFEGVTFSGIASFLNATFSCDANFSGATFFSDAEFMRATFASAGFYGATFAGSAFFFDATFSGDADFVTATFSNRAWFRRSTFCGGADFRRSTFSTAQHFGPLVCQGTVDLSESVFKLPTTMEIAAREVHCARIRWESTATLRLRYATVDLRDAVLSSPVAILTRPTQFDEMLDERLLIPLSPDVRLVSVKGVDAAHLVLSDIHLTECLFTEAFHLDQLRLEGSCTFARPPVGFHWRWSWYKVWFYWWSRRRTLAEEHHWRAERAGTRNPVPPRGWQSPTPELRGRGAESLAATYRQLRKALEDGKNEPGAADFYYGEMEMRRHDRKGTPGAERVLLWAYWLLSGYGLRALRAVGWLVMTILLTVALLMMFGLPGDRPGPTQRTQVMVTADQGVSLDTAPLEPDGEATGARFTGSRFSWATRTVLNSVVFRSAGEGLTASGTFIEMVSRFVEPILLVLALLAVRNRVKR